MNLNNNAMTLGVMGTLISSTILAVVYVFTTFARADDLADLEERLAKADERNSIELAYISYYARLDDYEESMDEGNTDLAAEHKRQMERLEGVICEADPEWERCDD